MDLVDDNFIKVILESIEGHENDNIILINNTEFKKGVVVAGNNYSSEIVQLTIEYTKNGIKKTQNFILKIFSSVPFYELGKLVGIYDKEVEMYKSVLPAMAELLLDNVVGGLIFPKVFKSLNPDILVLEDLRSSGYMIMDRIKQLDFQHSAVAFRTMGKFHALSIRLNEKSPNIVDKVKADIFYDASTNKLKVISDMYEKAFDSSLVKLKNIKETTNYVDSFTELKFKIFDKVKKLSRSNSKRKVLIHGDHWINNIMFKHDEDGNVIDNKLIDFQLSRWTTPAIDIWYFAVTSIAFRVFQLHFDSLIAIYYTSLNDALEKTGSDVRYTMEEIRKEIDDSIAFGVYAMLTVLPIITSDPSDPIDMTTIGNEFDNFNLEVFSKIYDNEHFLNVLVKWFSYFNERIDDVKKGLLVSG